MSKLRAIAEKLVVKEPTFKVQLDEGVELEFRFIQGYPQKTPIWARASEYNDSYRKGMLPPEEEELCDRIADADVIQQCHRMAATCADEGETVADFLFMAAESWIGHESLWNRWFAGQAGATANAEVEAIEDRKKSSKKTDSSAAT
jgi:threonine dehydratase